MLGLEPRVTHVVDIIGLPSDQDRGSVGLLGLHYSRTRSPQGKTVDGFHNGTSGMGRRNL